MEFVRRVRTYASDYGPSNLLRHINPGVIYEVTLEVKRTGIMASLGCDRCDGFTDKREQPAPPLLVRFFQTRIAFVSECNQACDSAIPIRSPFGTFRGHLTGRFHIEIILHCSPGEVTAAPQRRQTLVTFVPVSLFLLRVCVNTHLGDG